MRRSWYAKAGSDPEWDDEFRVDVVPERDVVRVCPIGELDLATVGDVRARLDELQRSGFSRIVLDFRGTTFIDSSGLRLVVDLHSASTVDGLVFGIIAGPPAVQRAFDVAGLTERLPFVGPRSA